MNLLEKCDRATDGSIPKEEAMGVLKRYCPEQYLTIIALQGEGKKLVELEGYIKDYQFEKIAPHLKISRILVYKNIPTYQPQKYYDWKKGSCELKDTKFIKVKVTIEEQK